MTSMAPSGPDVADDRRDDEVADARRLDASESARSSCWNSPLEVVADVDDPALGDGLARDALAEAQVASS